jgi:ribosomal protein L37AE/L43A
MVRDIELFDEVEGKMDTPVCPICKRNHSMSKADAIEKDWVCIDCGVEFYDDEVEA